MNTDTDAPDRPERDPLRVAFAVLICCTVLVAVVSFALSFYGLNDYGHRVMALPRWLSPLVPAMVDLFSLCGIAATYLMRRAAYRVRVYAWAVFLVPTGLSVAGNLAHAESRALVHAGLAGAAAAPVILALATHLVVVVRRHLETDTGPDMIRDLDPMPVWPEFEQVMPDVPVLVNGNGHRPAVDTSSDSAQARALTLLLDPRVERTVSEVATEVGVDPRTVQRWADRVHERARPRKSAGRKSAGTSGDSGVS
jgi:hypothetical protein